jgi:phosphoglycolate phosphatase
VADIQTILFDFDGTLVRTREASWELFRQTNEKFALGVDTPSAFFQLFDRNFYSALDDASGNNGAAEDVRRHFQALLRTEYSPQFVPGMTKVVRALAAHYSLIVLSSNTMEAVRRILLANGVANCFAHVFSGELAPKKNEAIARFLADPSYSAARRCTPNYEESMVPRIHEPSEAMLITDTVGDVTEGLEAGIRVGAVSWGMHGAEELERAGAEFVCIWPEELVAYLQPGEACSTGACHLPSAALAAPQAQSSVTQFNGAPAPAVVRRSRRTEAARRLADRIETETQEPCCTTCGTEIRPAFDPLLRRAIEAIQ